MADSKIINFNELISTNETAEILGISSKTVASWRERKLFGCPFFPADEKIGGTWYYYRERVEQLKAIYQKGILQNMYLLARNFSGNFQKSATSSETLTSELFFEELPTDLFTTEEVSKIFNIPEITLQEWNDSKKLLPFIEDHSGGFHYSREQLTQLAELRDKTLNKKSLPKGQSLKNFFDQPENNVVKKINVQVYPNKQRIVPNCKIAKTISNLTDQQFDDMIQKGDSRGIIEKKHHKKFGDIITAYRIVSDNEYDDSSDPLSEFDRDVLSVCISEWEVGNRYTTPAIIYRGLTGKVNKNTDAMPSKDQYAAIIHSIKKLISITLDTELSDVNEQLNYNDGKSQKIFSPLLPAELISTFVNGQSISDVVNFLSESPVMTIARPRKQLLTFDASILDIPKQQNTKMNITAKNYVMCRIQEIKLHKLQPIITFADVFQKCRIENADNKTKLRVRQLIIDFMEHLKSKGEIRGFEVTKKAQTFHSVKFSYSSKSKKFSNENDAVSVA